MTNREMGDRETFMRMLGAIASSDDPRMVDVLTTVRSKHPELTDSDVATCVALFRGLVPYSPDLCSENKE